MELLTIKCHINYAAGMCCEREVAVDFSLVMKAHAYSGHCLVTESKFYYSRRPTYHPSAETTTATTATTQIRSKYIKSRVMPGNEWAMFVKGAKM